MAAPSSVRSAASPTEGEVSQETRRAPAAFAFHDEVGTITAEGQSEAVIDDDGVTVGSITVAFLDAEGLWADDYTIEIGCWPSGRLVLNQLGRRYDTFTRELIRTRNQARVAGLLAHGIALPKVFPAAILTTDIKPVECQVYHTHVTLVPESGDPWQLPIGALKDLKLEDDPPSVVLIGPERGTTIGLLARRRDEFFREVTERRQAQARTLEAMTGMTIFADGRGIERNRIPRFEETVAKWCLPDRAAGAATLLQAAKGGEPRLGFVQLLDPESGAQEQLPGLADHWAAFLLVPTGPLVALEILAGPSAATYLFEGAIEEINRDLQTLHFRRAGLALQGKDGEVTPENPYRLALRKLEPLKRLRERTRARVIHHEGWTEAILSAVS